MLRGVSTDGGLVIECPRAPHWRERAYAVDVVMTEFLGVPYRLVGTDRRDVRVTSAHDPDGPSLVMPDALFSTPEPRWLTPAVLPARPLAAWAPPEWAWEGHEASRRLPVLYGAPDGSGAWHADGPEARLGLDVFGSVFFMLTRLEEVVAPVRDRYGRFPATASVAWQEGFLERPIVNEYVEVLFRALERLWPGLRRKARRYRLILSHDVDLPFFTSPRQLLKTGWQDLTRRGDPALAAGRVMSFLDARRGRVEGDPFNTFDWLMANAEAQGVTSAFNFIAGHSAHRVDGDYRLDDPGIARLIRRIHERGHELGLHPSYHTMADGDRLASEFARLRAHMAGAGIHQPAWGGRQHYLRWQAPATWRHWEAAGLAYDSSLAYADRVGFRCGTGDPFPAFDVTASRRLALIEVPLCVMDITLTVYMGLALPEAVEKLLALARSCRAFDAPFSLLWHNSSLVSAEQRRWYVEALGELTGPGAWRGSRAS